MLRSLYSQLLSTATNKNVAILSCLIDFVQHRMSFIFLNKGSTSQLWNLYARMLKLSSYVLLASIDTIYTFSNCCRVGCETWRFVTQDDIVTRRP